MPNPAEFPQWDQSKADDSLKRVYEWAIGVARENIKWYESRRPPARKFSQSFRALAIILGAIGGLCPLIDSTKFLANGPALGQWGYVSLAIAAALVLFDKYFGFSTGWMRNIMTQMSLEKALKEFQFDWAILNAQQQCQQPPQSNALVFLQKAKDFCVQIDGLIKQETDAWVAEFQTNIAELEKALKSEVAARKPGGIKITVKNARDFEKVELRLNDCQVKELVGVSESVLDSVPPGRHEIMAIGKKANKEFKESKVIEVQPATTASVEITLPTS